MKSIRDIYKIGKGPSSSHTMGPERAAKLFLSEHPEADKVKVILYGSLCKTGIGHGTDRVLREALSPVENELVFDGSVPEKGHPNTLDFYAYKDGQQTGFMRVASVGGGDIEIMGRPDDPSDEVYPENSFAEIMDFCKWSYVSTLSEYVEMNEGPEIWDFLREVWHTMNQAITDGLNTTGILPGGLKMQRKAKHLFEQELSTEVAQVRECRLICAYAFAVSEQNADNGTIVTAPTCGAAGVLPAVLRYIHESGRATEEQVIRALGTAGIIGNLAKRNASISGAECGCQAEVGVACAMAAAAASELYGLNLERVEYAAEIALEHHLGLTCDPICGLVQVPCIERNAVAAMRAMNACNLSYFLCGTRNISFDMVCKAMYETGLNLSHQYKETSEGGLARFYNRRRSFNPR